MTTTKGGGFLSSTKAVGATVGNHSVTPSGALTYHIPIAAPEGTMGMQPSISLAYNSQSGNGQLGKGWSLVGLSSISRVTKNLFFDDEVAPIKNEISDQYALDGNRLVLNSGNQGYNNSTYKTHMETFSKIIAKGSQGNGPEYFIVNQKNGLTYEYGRTEDSRFAFEGANPGVISWLVNKVYDCHGNYMTFKYKTEEREIRIDKICYTGNSTAGLRPYNEIKFNYDYRDDTNHSFVAGSRVNSKILLTEIISKTNGDDVYRKYKLKYAFDGTYSLLQELEESGVDGTEYNTTRFLFEPPDLGLSTVYPPNVHAAQRAVSRDYNGDGLSDLLYVKTIGSGSNTITRKTLYLRESTGWSNPPLEHEVSEDVSFIHTQSRHYNYSVGGVKWR